MAVAHPCGRYLALLDGLAPRGWMRPSESYSVPLQEASLRLEQGAGRIELGAGAEPGAFLTGVTGVGMNRSARLEGSRLVVKIEAGPGFVPFIGPAAGVWQYRLHPEIPTSLSIRAGASRLDLDLSALHVTVFSFEGGASTLNLTLPAGVDSVLADIQAGAAGIDVRVPPGVGLRFRTKSVGSLDVDQNRFPRREPGLYQSADYESSKYHADLSVNGGATSIHVH